MADKLQKSNSVNSTPSPTQNNNVSPLNNFVESAPSPTYSNISSPTYPQDWQETTLGEVVEMIIDHRGKTPKKLGGDWSKSGYRAISAKTVKNGVLVNEEQMNLLSDDLYKNG